MRALVPLLLLLQAAAAGQDVEFDLSAARHLWNRAGFGLGQARLERCVELGREATVERLFETGETEPFFVEPITWPMDKRELRMEGPDALRRARNALRQSDRQQRDAYLADWMARLLAGEDPLRERMTLFWHGVFTTQASKVKDSYLLVRQSQLLREHALGNYGNLLRAVLRDPAMLRYLDNDTNEREHPNENLARELLELFSLGEGNYTEEDVTEVARALTGYGYSRERGFEFSSKKHDPSNKTVLGVRERHDADSVVDVLLAQPSCARWIARRLITYLEGLPPAADRLEDYANYLRGRNYELEPFLRRLFADPEFYRPEVVGARVLSPVDYLVGHCRRLGLRPDPRVLVNAADLLGEELFEPPNVKGWEGGDAWITTSTFLARGNVLGGLLGVLSDPELLESLDEPQERMDDLDLGDETDVVAEEGLEDEMMAEATDTRRKDQLAKMLRGLDGNGYLPRVNLTRRLERLDARRDKAMVNALCDQLLAIEAPLETRRMLTRFLRTERQALDVERGALLEAGPAAEHLLRRLVHLILSLPEAQLG